MADRSVGLGDSLNSLRLRHNATASDIGEIATLQGTSGIIASATDVVEAVVLLNTDVDFISTDPHIFGSSLIFEGATDDSYETTVQVTDPTADRTFTLPDAGGDVVLIDVAQTMTNKTFPSTTSTSPVLNTSVSGSAVLDEDDLSSNSATKVATQQSIKAYTDAQLTAQDLDFQGDSGGALNIDLNSETLTVAGGTGLASSATGNAVTLAIDSTVATLTGSQTLTNKTFTSPTINEWTFASGNTMSGLTTESTIVFEGATADAHETSLNVKDPTQDNVITIPDSTMTAVTTATHSSKGTVIAKVMAMG